MKLQPKNSKPNIKIKYRKLGKEKAWGIAHSDGLIEIDPSIKSRKHLEIVIHEVFHILFPEATEKEVIEKSITLTKILWSEHYRRIEPEVHEPLQDGTK